MNLERTSPASARTRLSPTVLTPRPKRSSAVTGSSPPLITTRPSSWPPLARAWNSAAASKSARSKTCRRFQAERAIWEIIPGITMAEVSDNKAAALVDHLFRHQAGRMIATLTRIFGPRHIDLAEEVVQEALVKALQQWPYRGVPENPTAWLIQVAKNRARRPRGVDAQDGRRLRRERNRAGLSGQRADRRAAPGSRQTPDPRRGRDLRSALASRNVDAARFGSRSLVLALQRGLHGPCGREPGPRRPGSRSDQIVFAAGPASGDQSSEMPCAAGADDVSSGPIARAHGRGGRIGSAFRAGSLAVGPAYDLPGL